MPLSPASITRYTHLALSALNLKQQGTRPRITVTSFSACCHTGVRVRADLLMMGGNDATCGDQPQRRHARGTECLPVLVHFGLWWSKQKKITIKGRGKRF
jgi:hypothetical protein